jgi:hypothetical protein
MISYPLLMIGIILILWNFCLKLLIVLVIGFLYLLAM